MLPSSADKIKHNGQRGLELCLYDAHSGKVSVGEADRLIQQPLPGINVPLPEGVQQGRWE